MLKSYCPVSRWTIYIRDLLRIEKVHRRVWTTIHPILTVLKTFVFFQLQIDTKLKTQLFYKYKTGLYDIKLADYNNVNSFWQPPNSL